MRCHSPARFFANTGGSVPEAVVQLRALSVSQPGRATIYALAQRDRTVAKGISTIVGGAGGALHAGSIAVVRVRIHGARHDACPRRRTIASATALFPLACK